MSSFWLSFSFDFVVCSIKDSGSKSTRKGILFAFELCGTMKKQDAPLERGPALRQRHNEFAL